MSNVTCKSFPDHPEDCDAVNIVRRVLGVFSCLSCLFVVFIIWVFGRYSLFAQRLVLSLTIAAFFNGLGRIFQDAKNEHGASCTFQAFWLNYFNYAVMLWVVCITFNLFMKVIKDIATSQFEKCYHGVGWGLSLAISLIPFIGGRYVYGPSGSWCWIVNDIGWQLGIWYVPLIITILVLVTAYVYIVITIYRKADSWTHTYTPESRQTQASLKEEIKPLRLYPFVFLLLSIFPLVNRIHNAISDGPHVLALVLLHTISASVQGAAYALVFAVDRDTLRSLTYTQIRAAILKKFAPPAVVQEYPVGGAGTEDTTENPETPEARY